MTNAGTCGAGGTTHAGRSSLIKKEAKMIRIFHLGSPMLTARSLALATNNVTPTTKQGSRPRSSACLHQLRSETLVRHFGFRARIATRTANRSTASAHGGARW